ncbi:TetR/AcrR family transcriptional regulator [Nocardiopsis coralliicola]
MKSTRSLSTAEQRRGEIVEAAVEVFAEHGYTGSTVAQVGRAAGISSAYVFKLFPTKRELFTAALDRGFERIDATLRDAASAAAGQEPQAVLDTMGGAYAELIRDRSLLLLQVHAMSAAHLDEEIAVALRAGLARVITTASALSGADAGAVQNFMAFGQLCHLIVTAGVTEDDDPWAQTLARGIRHPD